MLVRRRYYTWLFKAYIKRWKKTILYSVVAGILICAVGITTINFYLIPLFEKKVQRIGFAGGYTTRNVPEPLLRDLSYGLTEISPNGQIMPKAASKWEIKQNGKEYLFYIKPGQYFHNGDELTEITRYDKNPFAAKATVLKFIKESPGKVNELTDTWL